MSGDLLIANVRVVRPGEGIEPGSVLVSDGKIARIDRQSAPPARPGDACQHIDGKAGLLTPGLIDLHTHGLGACLYERSEEDILQASQLLPRHGTTCVLPTLYRVMNRSSLNLLERLADALPKARGATMPGFHLEGPFLALPGAGAATVPGDTALLEELLAACKGRVLAMSISPDTPRILPVIERLVERRIVPFITHTRASAEQTQAAIDAGARHATHFYDVFPVPAETEPGVRPAGAVEAILADPRVSVDFICDGVHVSPFAIRAALAAKGFAGIVLITDSNIGAGLPDGEYDTTWGYRVRVRAGDAARIASPQHPMRGALAGSALTMDRGIGNLLAWLGPHCAEHEIWAMATSNPARVAGLNCQGRLQVGADADLVLWDQQLQPVMTWVKGQLVYGQTP